MAVTTKTSLREKTGSKGTLAEAKAKKSGKKSISAKVKKSIWEMPFEMKNFKILGIGVLVIIIGYILMSTGVTEDPAVVDGKWNNPVAIVLAPFLLIIGYCIIIPYGIYKYFKTKHENQEETI